jgi:molybdate transport system substrate-binding protein
MSFESFGFTLLLTCIAPTRSARHTRRSGPAPQFFRLLLSRIVKRDAFSVLVATVAILLTTLTADRAGSADTSKLVVFAAASLKTALDEINAQWFGRTGKRATISYAASPALAKQIDQGAPADVFVSADLAWMDYLAHRKLIRSETRRDLVGNRLVLIAPRGSGLRVKVEAGFPLPLLLGSGRLAMANTDAVPAGKYGKAALASLGVWDQVKDRVVQAENVRAALVLVSRGEAPLGIVYHSDAISDAAVELVGSFPNSTHPAIIYPVAITTDARSQDANAFIEELKSAGSRAIFEKHGLSPL